jgi:probable rRNA maturation factor
MSSEDPSTFDSNESLQVDVRIDEQVTSPLDVNQIARCVRAAATHRGYTSGSIGVLVTDDPTIHQINRDHLDHDYPTDVISFAYHAQANQIEGELVVSVDTARTQSASHGITEQTELSLYLIHGTLHIAGMDDHEELDRTAMRTAERDVLKALNNREFDRIGTQWAPNYD